MKKHFNQVMIVIIYMVINASFSFSQTSNIGRGPFELNDNNVITPFPIDTVVINLKFYLIHQGLNRDDPIPNPNAIDISESDVIDFMVDISEAFNPHGIYFHYFQSQIDHIYDSNYYDYPDNYSCDILEYGGQENSLILYLGPAEITHGYSRAMSIPGLRLLVSGSVFEEYSKAIIHELGHCLGLFHTHHDDSEATTDGCGFSTPDNSACEETISGDNCQVCGDYVCDTNADPGLSGENVDLQTCNYIPQDGYNPPTDNYMSYAPIMCQNNFTEDQGNRMFNHIFQYEDLRRTAVTWFVIKDVATNTDELLYGSMKFDILATPGTDYLSLYSGEVVHIPLTFFFNDGGIMRPSDNFYYDSETLTNPINGLFHYNWDDYQSQHKMKYPNFQLGDQHVEYGIRAFYKEKYDVTILSQIVPIELWDPWYAYPEQGNWVQPDEFRPLSEQDDEQGNVQVFLDQNETFNPLYPIYSLKASQLYHDGNDVNYIFDSWKAFYSEDNEDLSDDIVEFESGCNSDNCDVVFMGNIVNYPNHFIRPDYKQSYPVSVTTSNNVDIIIVDPWYWDGSSFQNQEVPISNGEHQVFLNESYTISVNQAYDIIDDNLYFFESWSGTDVSINSPNDMQTTVEFLHEDATLIANYQPAIATNIPGDYPTIQSGINSINTVGLVLIQPGTYYENINFDGKTIIVASLYYTTGDEQYIDNTIIDGSQDNSAAVVMFVNQETEETVLSGFTITGGNSIAGGILCDNSNPTLNNLRIVENTGLFGGGGIVCYQSSPSISNSTIANNYAPDGGGIYCIDSSNPTLKNVAIVDNYANRGGGIFCQSDSSPYLDNVTLVNNSGGYGAAGIVLQFYSRITVVNSILYNSAGEEIVFIGSYGSGPTFHDDPVIVAFSYVYQGESGIWGSGSGNGIDYIYDYDTNLAGFMTYGPNDVIPMFVDGDSDGDYHLQGNSPCIDAGDPDLLIDPDGTTIDMGAYYFYQRRGDVNQDFMIDVLDIVMIVSITLDSYIPTVNQFRNADVNEDGLIDVLDIVELVNCIGAGTCFNLERSDGEVAGGNATVNLTSPIALARSDDEENIISINSEVPVRGFQMVIEYNAEEFEFSLIEKLEAASGLVLEYNVSNPGIVKFILYPEDSFEIPAGEHDILQLSFTGLGRSNDGRIGLSYLDPILSDPYGNKINVVSDLETPGRFALHPAYPNPFNPITNIEYALPRDGRVSLTVYSLTGQQVATLVNESKTAGYYQVQWNGRDDLGIPVASGLYFYHLKADGFDKTKKMLLLK